ncbi:hypothetical protein D047_2501A, partial [Vibrio parahaemolyticus VPTS-2010_2]
MSPLVARTSNVFSPSTSS